MSGGETEARDKGDNAMVGTGGFRFGGDTGGEGEDNHCLWYPLSQVTSFKYMGIVLATEDDEWPSVVRNLRRARQNWAWLTRILIREGADAQTSEHISFAVVQ